MNMFSFIDVFDVCWQQIVSIHILLDYFIGTGAVRELSLSQCSNPEWYGLIYTVHLLRTNLLPQHNKTYQNSVDIVWCILHTRYCMGCTAYPILYGVYCIPDTRLTWVNSLAPGEFDYSLQLVNYKLISMINILSIFCAIVIRWMLQQLTDHQSTLVQAMAWCRQATSHYLSQCWPRPLSPYGITRPQWVNRSGDTPSWLNYRPQFQLCIPRGLSHLCRQSDASSAKLGQLACDSQGQPQGQKISNLIPGWARNPSYKRVHQFIMQTL